MCNDVVAKGGDVMDLEKILAPVFERPSIGPRARNMLRNASIFTIGDLCKCTKFDLIRTPNLGRKTLQAIEDALLAHGLYLSDGEHDESRNIELRYASIDTLSAMRREALALVNAIESELTARQGADHA
jgi:DNA-directed RNA polymerase alpha subunit